MPRNDVIGKVHRLGLSGRATRVKKHRPRIDERRNNGNGKRAARTTAAKKLSPAKAILGDGQPLPPPHETDIARVTFAEMEQHHCKWPLGEPTVGFCGAERVHGLPYCTHHVKRAFTAWQPTDATQALSLSVALVANRLGRRDGQALDRVEELLKEDA